MHGPQPGPVDLIGRAVPRDHESDRTRSGRKPSPGLAIRDKQAQRHDRGTSIAMARRALESVAFPLTETCLHGEAGSRSVSEYRCRRLDALRIAPRTPVAQLPL